MKGGRWRNWLEVVSSEKYIDRKAICSFLKPQSYPVSNRSTCFFPTIFYVRIWNHHPIASQPLTNGCFRFKLIMKKAMNFVDGRSLKCQSIAFFGTSTVPQKTHFPAFLLRSTRKFYLETPLLLHSGCLQP